MRLTLVRGLLVAVLSPVAVCTAMTTEAPPDIGKPETTGQLNMISQPAVEVVWEGVSLGLTDAAGLLVVEGIPPGRYELLLRKPGYRDRTSQVQVAAGTQSIQMRLGSIPPLRQRPEPRGAARKPEASASADTPMSPAEELASNQPEPVVARTPTTVAAGGTSTPSDPMPAPAATSPALTPIPTSPLAPVDDSEAAGSVAVRPEPASGTLLPVVFFLGLALLGTMGVLAFQWRRRVRARAAFFAQPPPLAFQPLRNLKAEPPSFLRDIHRREVAMENLLDAGPTRGRADAVDVQSEVVEPDPVEDGD